MSRFNMEKQSYQFPKNNIEDLQKCISFIKNHYSNIQIYLLYGEVGRGKTTLIQHFFPNTDITSPSFVGYAIYDDIKLFHIDTYFKQNIPLHMIKEYLDQNYVIFIEWPVYINQLQSYNLLHIYINEDTYTISN